jgi:hypothetical protein
LKSGARKNPAYLGEYALGLTAQPFHVEWGDAMREHHRLLEFAPVEHGKSTQFSVLAPMHDLGHHPNWNLGIFSRAATMSEQWLGQVKANIEHNPLIHVVYPELRREDRAGWPKAWLQDRIIIRRTAAAIFTDKDFSIQARGIMAKILGTRLDGATIDDVLGPDNTMTETMRVNVWNWFVGVLIGRVKEHGFIRIVGTAWHELDMAHKIEKTLSKATGGPYHVARYQAGAHPCVWTERWSERRLLDRRQELGEVEYNRQMLNIALGETTGFFNIAKVRRCQELCDDPPGWWGGLDEEGRKQFRWITAGVDLGMSKKEGSAETAIVVLGMGRDRLKHVIHVRAGIWMGLALFEQLADVYLLFGVKEFLVETNAAQAQIASFFRDHKVLAMLGLTIDQIRGLRVFGQYTTGQNRDDVRWGIRGMSPEIESEIWRLPQHQPQLEQLVDGMRRYTPWDTPDHRLIALWLASVRMKGRGTPIALEIDSRRIR